MTSYLMVGNPGVGKSTILNGFANKVLFESGPSFGAGKTKVLQSETVGADTFMDTPGLADINLRKQAAAAITEALQKGGVFKIFFVVTLEAGRVKPADRTTMELVLASAPISHYGVIINKLEDEELEALMEDPDAQDSVKAGLLNNLPTPSLYFHFEARRKDLAGKKNQGLGLGEEMKKFIVSVPEVNIAVKDVKGIRIDEFEAMTEKFETLIAQLHDDKKILHQKMAEDKKMYEALVEEMKERTASLEASLKEAKKQKDRDDREAKEEKKRLEGKYDKTIEGMQKQNAKVQQSLEEAKKGKAETAGAIDPLGGLVGTLASALTTDVLLPLATSMMMPRRR